MKRSPERALAQANGLPTYFTGKPCKNGHIAERRTANKGCVECTRPIEAKRARDRRATLRAKRPPKLPFDKIAYNREWRNRNIEKARAYARAYYAAHSEHLMALTVAWTRRNRDKQHAAKSRRRAAENGALGTHSASDLSALMQRQGGRCFYCDGNIETRYSVDHFIPLSKGGSNWPDNLRLACKSCNSRKHNKLPSEFRWPKRSNHHECRSS